MGRRVFATGGCGVGGRGLWSGAATAREAALWLLVPSLGLISHTYAPVPPILLFFMAALPLALYGLDPSLNGSDGGRAWGRGFGARPEGPPRPFLWWVACYVGYLFIDQYILGASLRNVWGVISSVCYAVLPLLLWGDRGTVWSPVAEVGGGDSAAAGSPEIASGVGSPENLFVKHRRKFDWAFRIALAVYTVEALWRYGMAWLSAAPSVYQGIYRYKFGGLMYSESNATGIHILIWLFFTLWWMLALHRHGLSDRRTRIRYSGMAVWWSVLLGLTLSRACWGAGVIGLLYFCLMSLLPARNLKYVWTGLLVCLFVGGALFALWVYPRVQYDASFISKFQIVYAFLDYWRQASWLEMLFGIGLTRSEIVMGVYAHSYGLVFLVETGLMGFLLMIGLFVRMLADSRGEGLCLLIPFAIATLSTTVLFVPELFLFLSFMMATRQTERADVRGNGRFADSREKHRVTRKRRVTRK